MEGRVILPTTITPVHYSLTLIPNFTLSSFDGLEVVDVFVSGQGTY
jgi:hypothetical protein